MRLILTGTPLQNDLTELWKLIEYAGPQLFSHKDAYQRYLCEAAAAPSSRREFRACEEGEDEGCEDVAGQKSTKRRLAAGVVWAHANQVEAGITAYEGKASLLACLKTALRPFVLRRVKATVGIELPPKHDLVLPTPLTPKQRAYHARVEADGRYSFSRPMHLRKCCIRPFLIDNFCKGYEAFGAPPQAYAARDRPDLML
ncbi:hypothetical protein LSCM4_03339 [Leishmania orientalis]|uniref:SNF2 N-terminal domain-containing protein n=1 Tax=Leishmania orientalis TaxID=2249476 RepID=A0A836KIC9_9TRYP|nr:hypothetical protein LSCM4_03339 [Leishmania orientalis]